MATKKNEVGQKQVVVHVVREGSESMTEGAMLNLFYVMMDLDIARDALKRAIKEKGIRFTDDDPQLCEALNRVELAQAEIEDAAFACGGLEEMREAVRRRRRQRRYEAKKAEKATKA